MYGANGMTSPGRGPNSSHAHRSWALPPPPASPKPSDTSSSSSTDGFTSPIRSRHFSPTRSLGGGTPVITPGQL